jgi:hypothetical protein
MGLSGVRCAERFRVDRSLNGDTSMLRKDRSMTQREASRMLHTMLRVGELDRSLKFYEVLESTSAPAIQTENSRSPLWGMAMSRDCGHRTHAQLGDK